MRFYQLGLLLFAVLMMTACSPLRLLDVITPTSGYTLHSDLAYGELPRQKLDVYVPDRHDAYRTVIVFFYGGSWQTGDKSLYRFVGQSLASRGYTVVLADYRLYPQAYFPAFVDDAARVVVWAHQHIADYQGDPQHLYLAGHSAGAHLAMLVTLDKHYLTAAGGAHSWIKGTIGLAGPYDFLPLADPNLIALFGKVPLAQTQPINFVETGEPPILLLHGTADTSVRLSNSAHLATKLAAYHDPVVFKTYSDVDHMTIVQALSVRFADKAPTVADMVDFITATNKH